MITAATNETLSKLDALRTELVDLAFELECRGQVNAADVAVTTSIRLGELCEEFAAEHVASIAGDARRMAAGLGG